MSGHNRFTIPEHLAYRVIDGKYAIIIDWMRGSTHLLYGKTFTLWNNILGDEAIDITSAEEQKMIDTLAENRLISSGTDYIGGSGVKAKGIQDEESVIGRWASVNYLPINGSFELTGVCNLRCNHCYSVHTQNHGLSLDAIKDIIVQMKQCGTLMLTLTGGEIFTRPDWRDIFAFLCENKFSFRINTNGNFITEEVAKSLMDYPQLSHIHVSVYSGDSKAHDGLTKVGGSFDKSVQALTNLKKHTNKNLRINCTVMKANEGSYRNVKYQIGDPLGIPVRYDARLVAMDDGCRENLTERLTDEQLTRHYEWMLREGLLSFDALINPKNTKEEQIGLCGAGFSYFSVSYEGILYPCFQLRAPLGSLLEHSFFELWHGNEFLKNLRGANRETLHDCVDCALKTCCNLCIGMSHLEDGDVFGKSNECCRDARIRHKIAQQMLAKDCE